MIQNQNETLRVDPYRSSHMCSPKKLLIKNSQYSQKKPVLESLHSCILVNIAKCLRTPISKNISGRLLLILGIMILLLTSSNWSAKQRRRKNSKCTGLLTFSLKSKSCHQLCFLISSSRSSCSSGAITHLHDFRFLFSCFSSICEHFSSLF